MADSPVLVLGTHNNKKREELWELVAPLNLGLKLLTLEDFEGALEVDEDGQTFAENARKKAAEQALHLGRWVLAEDSGLCVDALDGRPGVYSARFAGPTASDEDNNRLLLEQLANIPLERRGAHSEIPEYHQTFGQLGPAVKRALSHRGRAMRQMIDPLQRLIASGRWQ